MGHYEPHTKGGIFPALFPICHYRSYNNFMCDYRNEAHLIQHTCPSVPAFQQVGQGTDETVA